MSFYDKLKNCKIQVDALKNSTILITGGSGMIGTILAENLMELEDELKLGIKLLLMVRDENKASKSLEKYFKCKKIKLVTGDIVKPIEINESADYIIHTASITASKAMIEKPVEVILTSVYGTKNILDYAKKVNAKSVVYLSSMEVYGFTEDETLLNEDNIQYLNPLAIRSCYPESKRMAENMCVSYFSEYGVPVKIVRLAQTFGKGVLENDSRVFAEFVRCAQNGQNIVLKTDGSSKRMYLDTSDAASAIITVLLKGENAAAYNAANKETYCSIAEMAKMVSDEIAGGKIAVYLNKSENAGVCYPPAHKLFLDTSKIENLGWRAETGLFQMYSKMIENWLHK